MIPTTPNAGYQVTRKGRVTGYALDSTTIAAADFAAGAVVQLAATPTGNALTGSALRNSAGTTVADNGYAFGRPTAGYATPFAVISEDLPVNERNILNLLSDTANPTARDGGQVPLVIAGYTRALVKASVTKGVTLLAPVDGQYYLSPYIGNGLFGEITASSTAIVDSVSTEQTFSNGSYTIPANTIRAGTIISGRVHVNAVTGGAGTLTIKVKVGSTIVAQSASPVIVTGDTVTVDYAAIVRATGASAAFIACGLSYAGTSAVAAGAADIPNGSGVATTLDTTAATTISVTATWSTTASTSSCALAIHNCYLANTDTSLANKPFAIAMETVDNSAAAALTQILIVQPVF